MNFTTEHLAGHPELVRRAFESNGIQFSRHSGAEYRAACPFHPDKHPSLDVNVEKGLWKCRACGASGDVVDFYSRAHGVSKSEAIAALSDDLGLRRNGGQPRPASAVVGRARWDIRSTSGEIVATHLRRDLSNGTKGFSWERNGAPTLDRLPVVDLPLYGSQLVRGWPTDTPILVVEGEKATDVLLEKGFRALGTVTGAAATPGEKALQVLRGRDVFLWPDHDEPGRAHMNRIAAALQGIVKTVRLLSWGEQKGDDAADFFARGGTAEQLDRLLADSPSAETAASSPGIEEGDAELPSQLGHPTDLSNARLFVSQHRNDVRYVHDARAWYFYDGRRWTPDRSGHVERLAKATVESLFQAAGAEPNEERRDRLRRHALRSQDGHRIESLLKLARSEREVSVERRLFDTDSWLLNCENGTIDLRAGVLRPHDRSQMLTKLAPVAFDNSATSPAWNKFLQTIMAGNAGLISYLQRALGYSLTGDASEQKFFVGWGSGANGKSTFLRTGHSLLGDYAVTTSIETLIVKRGSSASNDVARLASARFVSAVEAEEGQRLAEERVKNLTGGDSVAARFLYQEHFEFRPTFKLWLATNHRPEIRGTDEAIWRRINLVPFTVSIPEPEQDRKLPEKLLAELPGILTWAVAGCLQWQARGLREPSEVRRATADYRREEDILGGFLGERCFLDPTASTPASELYASYVAWSQRAGERAPLSQKKLGPRLRERNLEVARDSLTGRNIWCGVGLNPGEQP